MPYKKIFLLGGILFFSTGITLYAAVDSAAVDSFVSPDNEKCDSCDSLADATQNNCQTCIERLTVPVKESEATAPRRRVGTSPVMSELLEALKALPRPCSEDNPIGTPCTDFDSVVFKVCKIKDEAEKDREAAEWLVKVKAKHAEIERENAAYEIRKKEKGSRQKAEAAATKKRLEEECVRKLAEHQDTADRMARSRGYSNFDAMQKEIERSTFSGSSTSASAGSGWKQGPSTRFGRSGNAGSNKNAPFLTPLRVSWIAAFIGAQIARFSLYVEIEKEILEENRRNDITMTPQEIAVEIQREIEGKRSEHYKRRNAQRIETALNIIGIMGFFADLFTGLA